MAEGRLTVADLLREDGLKLSLVAGPTGKDVHITGVHISEIPDPTPWLSPGDLLLTTGLSVHDDPRRQRELIGRLAEGGIAALGLAVGLYLDDTPTAMREAAEEHGLPLFEVPFEVPLKSVTSLIFHSLKDRRFYQLRRRLTVQDHLLDLLLEDRGLDYLVSSVAMLLSTSVIVFGSGGKVVTRADARVKVRTGLGEAIWAAYLERGCCTEPSGLEVGDARVYLTEVRLSGRVEQVLCLVYPRSEPLGEGAVTVAGYVQKLLALELARSREDVLVQTRMRASLLDDLLSGLSNGEEVPGRLRRFGFDPRRPARVLLLDIDDFGQHVLDRSQPADEERIQEIKTAFRERVDAFFSDLRAPFLSISKSDAVIVLVQLGGGDRAVVAAARELRGNLERQPPMLPTTVGISEQVKLPAGVPGGLLQAREAAGVSEGEAGDNVRLFSRLGPSLRLLDGRDPQWLADLAAETLGPLLRHDRERGDQLVDTLEAYLQADRSATAAAARLFVHPNTLRNRLKRIEELLGVDLSRTAVLVDLALALRCLRAGGPSGPEPRSVPRKGE